MPVVDDQRELVAASMNLVYESGEYFSLGISAELLDQEIQSGNQDRIHALGRLDEMRQEPRAVSVILVDSQPCHPRSVGKKLFAPLRTSCALSDPSGAMDQCQASWAMNLEDLYQSIPDNCLPHWCRRPKS